MSYTPIHKYKRKFEAIKKVEEFENKNLSIQGRFQQLSSLFSLGIGLGFVFRKRGKEMSLKSNWALLKA